MSCKPSCDQHALCKECCASALGRESWTLLSSFLQAQPRRLTLQVKIVDWISVNIIVEPGKCEAHCIEDYLLSLSSLAATHEIDANRYNLAINEILCLCRRKYARSAPQFPTSLWVRTATEGLQIIEEIDPLLLSALQPASLVLGNVRTLPPLVPSAHLSPVLRSGSFFLPNTRLVRYDGREYVAKGPIYPSRVHHDFAEVRNLLTLPRGHPNIMPPPWALITVSEADERICGFLTPFYPNGNLDIYARKLRERGALTPQVLCKWFRELVSTVQFLAEHGTWHGDIKPDNILVDDNGDIVLIDFARTFATFATASPEVRRHSSVASESLPPLCSSETICPSDDASTFVGIPGHWPLSQVIPSEIFSIGRTMYLICESISMIDIYREIGWINYAHEFTSDFSSDSTTPECLQLAISRCLATEPDDRVSLPELADLLGKLSL